MSICMILYCSDLYTEGRKSKSSVLSLQSSTTRSAGIVVKRYRLIKVVHIEIIMKYEKSHSLT